jgi:hypothetical protein
MLAPNAFKNSRRFIARHAPFDENSSIAQRALKR